MYHGFHSQGFFRRQSCRMIMQNFESSNSKSGVGSLRSLSEEERALTASLMGLAAATSNPPPMGPTTNTTGPTTSGASSALDLQRFLLAQQQQPQQQQQSGMSQQQPLSGIFSALLLQRQLQLQQQQQQQQQQQLLRHSSENFSPSLASAPSGIPENLATMLQLHQQRQEQLESSRLLLQQSQQNVSQRRQLDDLILSDQVMNRLRMEQQQQKQLAALLTASSSVQGPAPGSTVSPGEQGGGFFPRLLSGVAAAPTSVTSPSASAAAALGIRGLSQDLQGIAGIEAMAAAAALSRKVSLSGGSDRTLTASLVSSSEDKLDSCNRKGGSSEASGGSSCSDSYSKNRVANLKPGKSCNSERPPHHVGVDAEEHNDDGEDDNDDDDDDVAGGDVQGDSGNDTFPFKLYRMLACAEQDGTEDIVSFAPNGKAFSIRKPREFVTEIMPKYFTTTRMSSFQRQLNLYGFRRISEGSDKGGYFHPQFIKGHKALCKKIKRKKTAVKPPPNFFAPTLSGSLGGVSITGTGTHGLGSSMGAAIEAAARGLNSSSAATVRQLLADSYFHDANSILSAHALLSAGASNANQIPTPEPSIDQALLAALLTQQHRNQQVDFMQQLLLGQSQPQQSHVQNMLQNLDENQIRRLFGSSGAGTAPQGYQL